MVPEWLDAAAKGEMVPGQGIPTDQDLFAIIGSGGPLPSSTAVINGGQLPPPTTVAAAPTMVLPSPAINNQSMNAGASSSTPAYFNRSAGSGDSAVKEVMFFLVLKS